MEKCLEVEGWQAGQGVPAQGAEAVVGERGRVACRPSACGMQLLPHPVFINYMAVEEAVHRVMRRNTQRGHVRRSAGTGRLTPATGTGSIEDESQVKMKQE